MSEQTIKLVVAGVLLLHGLGHGGALGALAWIRLRPGTPSGAWHAAQSWLIPSLAADTAMTVASAVWVASLAGFVIAAMSFWGVLVPESVWRPLAVASALVSIAGITCFFGTWPMFNTLAALAVNVAVLVAVLGLRWSPATPLGS